ncbi:MAG TPA: DUF4271 domain-containing protein [Hanamia sp.]|nr:DUF4271 domain-containing protein [Hanamia sp.]
MKLLIYFFISTGIIFCSTPSFAQDISDTSLPQKSDTDKKIVNEKAISTIKKNITDTAKAQKRRKPILLNDTLNRKRNSASAIQNITVQNKIENDSSGKNSNPDTIAVSGITPLKSNHFDINKLLVRSRFINVKDAPVFFIEEGRHASGKEFLFYSLCIIVLILALFKTFYKGYFNNLFRVYFNTSLRQTQLADQLLQAKLPSLILNIFFAISVGVYIWLLFGIYHPPRLISSKLLLPFCILSVALLYFFKYCILKFMGWVADISQTTDNYIFAIFLVNKITGILLVPIIILLAFLKREWVPIVTNLSFMFLVLFFISRYVKSYGAIEKKMPLNPFHFLIYIAGGEIIPLVIIYKLAVDYLI